MGDLTPTAVRNLGPGRHRDGGGLYLLVKPTGARSWLLRVQFEGTRRDIGLGGVELSSKADHKPLPSPIEIPILQRKVLTLADAREKARILRGAAKAGLNPIAERDQDRASVPTFREAATRAHEALKDGWTVKGANTFINSLTTHSFPGMGDIRVDAVTSADITAALAPIWTAKPDMARKVRQRIGTVLNFAHSKGWRPTEAPGRSVTVGLPRQPRSGNFEAMPYADVPDFVATLLSKPTTTGRRVLLFQIYTAARPGEVRGARWGQIDFAKREWNRPADLMKGADALAHTVTLNNAAIAMLEQVKGDRTPRPSDLIFPGRGGAMLSDMTANKVLRDMKLKFDAHAFRSSFRDWAAEKMRDIPDPVAEAALSHVVPDKVIRAYKRTTFMEMRRELLEAWGGYVRKAQSLGSGLNQHQKVMVAARKTPAM